MKRITPLILAAGTFLGRAFVGWKYQRLAAPGALEEWIAENRIYHEANPEEQPTLEERTVEGLIEQVAESATANRVANREKSAYSFRGRAATLAAAFFLVATFVPFRLTSEPTAVDRPTRTDSIQEVPMDTDSSSQRPQQDPAGVAPQNPAQGEKPPPAPKKTPFPKPEKFREGERGPKRRRRSTTTPVKPSKPRKKPGTS